MELKERILLATSTASVVVVIELFYHWFLVFPFESIGYFLAKFVFGFSAALLIPESPLWISALGGGLIFTSLLSGWYYLAFLTNNPAISTCVTNYPSYNCETVGLPSTIYFKIAGYPITATTFSECLVHFLLFAASFTILYSLISKD